MGGSDLIAKEFFALKSNVIKKKIGEQINVIWLVGTIILILMLIISSFTNVAEDIIKLDSRLIILAISVSAANALISLLTTIFQLEKQTFRYSIFVNLKTLTNILASIFLIVFIGYAWEGRVSGIAGSSLIFFFASIVIFKIYGIKFSCPSKNTLKLAVTGLPFMIAHITGWAMEMIDKLMINNFISLEATGLYSIGYRFGMVVMMIEVAFSRAWLPFFYEKIQSGNADDKLSIVKATYFYAIFLLIISLVFGIAGKYLLYFMVDESYHKADVFIFLIGIGYFFDGIWKVFIGYLVHLNKAKVYSYIIGCSAVVNIILNYILLPRIGLIGAAWATAISFAFGAILTMIIAMRSYKMPWLLFLRKKD